MCCISLVYLHIEKCKYTPTLLCLIKYSFFTKMVHPEVTLLIVPSRCLHNRHLLSNSSLKILFLKWFVLISLSWTATIVLSASFSMSQSFIYWYDCSLSTSFSPMLHGNCSCTFSFVIFLSSSLLCCPSFFLLLSAVLYWSFLLPVILLKLPLSSLFSGKMQAIYVCLWVMLFMAGWHFPCFSIPFSLFFFLTVNSFITISND